MVKLWLPFSQVTVSSAVVSVALRDCGAALFTAGPVSADPTVGKFKWNPFVFATLPVYIPMAISGKNCTGSPL